CIPKRVPLLAINELGRKFDFELPQWLHLLLGEPALGGSDFEFRYDVAPKHNPATAAFPHGQLMHDRLTFADGEAGAQLVAALALPGDLENAFALLSLQSIQRFRAAEIAIQSLARCEARIHACPPEYRCNFHFVPLLGFARLKLYREP